MYVHSRLSTEIMHRWMVRDLKTISGYEAIDLGCGYMQNKRYLKVDKYVGIDLDEERISKGILEYPDAEGYVSTIEDFNYESGADIVLCIQVMVNTFFNEKKTEEVIRKIVNLNKSGGSLAFTIGPKNLKYEDKIDLILKSKYSTVKKRVFRKLPLLGRFSYFFGFIGSFFPFLWKTENASIKNIYYFCSDKLE